MSKWAAVDWIVATLTAGIVVSILIVVAETSITDEDFTDSQAQMLVGLISSMIAIISVYVGAKVKLYNTQEDGGKIAPDEEDDDADSDNVRSDPS